VTAGDYAVSAIRTTDTARGSALIIDGLPMEQL
jgi:hypothetical protein